jgi:hypothetical protein
VREPSTTKSLLPPGVGLIVFEYAIGVNGLGGGEWRGTPIPYGNIDDEICIQYPIMMTL